MPPVISPKIKYTRGARPTPDHSHHAETIAANLAMPEGVTVSRTALVCSQELSIDNWKSLGRTLSQFEGSIQWWIGDWWHYGFHRYGERKAMATAKDAFDRAYAFGTLMNCGYVAGRIETSFRNEVLSWTHHYAVASFEPEQQKRWLDIAAKDKLSVGQLRDKMWEAKNGVVKLTDEEQIWRYLQQLENAAQLPQSPSFTLGPPPWLRADVEQYLEHYLKHSQEVRFNRPPGYLDRPYHPPDLASLGKAVEDAAAFWTETREFFRRIQKRVDEKTTEVPATQSDKPPPLVTVA